MPHAIQLNRTHWDSTLKRFIYEFPGRDVKFQDQKVLLSHASIYNSFFNVSASNGNNTIEIVVYARFTSNPLTGVSLGGSPVNSWTFEFVLDDGYYSLDAFSNALFYFFYIYRVYSIHPTSGQLRYPLAVSANSTAYASQLSFCTLEAGTTGYQVAPHMSFSVARPVHNAHL